MRFEDSSDASKPLLRTYNEFQSPKPDHEWHQDTWLRGFSPEALRRQDKGKKPGGRTDPKLKAYSCNQKSGVGDFECVG